MYLSAFALKLKCESVSCVIPFVSAARANRPERVAAGLRRPLGRLESGDHAGENSLLQNAA